VAGSRQGSGRETARKRHGMCESAFNTAGERHGMCESAFMQLPAAQSHACDKESDMLIRHVEGI
jgi:hypothetical protein